MSQYFNMSYTCRKENGDSEMEVTVSFENPDSKQNLIDKINTWLNAIGYGEFKVTKQ